VYHVASREEETGVETRRASAVLAVAMGVAVGAVALAIRYAPWPAPGVEGPKPAPQAPSAAGGAAPLPGPAVTTDRGAPAWTARSERYGRDPDVARACPRDMALVDGDFCPKLTYACARRSEEAGQRCAEYARGSRCAAETDHRRFCVDRHEWPNRIGENPHVYVDWNEAKALCAGAGKRLCRRSEWILACEGPKRLPYPWGFVRQPSPCNIDRSSLAFDVNAMQAEETREGELARLWQADRIGAHPDCVSSYGAYDLSGNVDEWTDDFADDPGTKNPSTLNGGYWGPVRDTCRLTTKTHGPTFRFYQVGFRCCADTIDGIAVPPARPFVDRDPEPEPAPDSPVREPYE
jgi:formylglycine-generating enzyme